MPRAPSCPFCESDQVELVSQFGSQLLTSQWACRACNSYFEAVREEFGERARAGDAGPPARFDW
jgi:transposase-like protein